MEKYKKYKNTKMVEWKFRAIYGGGEAPLQLIALSPVGFSNTPLLSSAGPSYYSSTLFRNTEIQNYGNTEIQNYRNTEIENFKFIKQQKTKMLLPTWLLSWLSAALLFFHLFSLIHSQPNHKQNFHKVHKFHPPPTYGQWAHIWEWA